VAIASAISGRVTTRRGPRVPMLVGLSTGAAGCLGLLSAGATTSYPVLIAPLMAAGFGMALTMPAATAAVIEAAPADRAGIASGVLNAARQAGGALGVAVLGTLIAGTLVSGFHTAMFVSAGAFLTGAHRHAGRGRAGAASGDGVSGLAGRVGTCVIMDTDEFVQGCTWSRWRGAADGRQRSQAAAADGPRARAR
jgi:MFS family permease